MAILALTAQPARLRRIALEIEALVFAVDPARVSEDAKWDLVLIDDDVASDSISLVSASVAAGQRTIFFMREPDLQKTMFATRAGAFDVMTLPLDIERVRRALHDGGVAPVAWQSAAAHTATRTWVGSSPALLEAFRSAAIAAAAETHVLIVGETGVGKELLARIIHEQGSRARGLFVPVTCGVLDDAVMAVELFGKDPALGASTVVSGHLRRTADGTLFLDDLPFLGAALQARLANALQLGRYSAIGSFETEPLQSRIIAASTRNLRGPDAQELRPDLLYHFGIEISIPPLRRRSEDIPLLASYFLEQAARAHQKGISGFAPDALELLRKYDWPGNVRELRNALERAVVLCRGKTIQPADLPGEITGAHQQLVDTDPSSVSLESLERRHIRQIWRMTGGHLGEAAELLGIHRNTLRRKMEQYGITDEDARV